MNRIGILATGSYVPDTVASNAEVAAWTGVTPEWIERKTAIRTRRYAAQHEAASDLAVAAARSALAGAALSADEIDYLIVCTSTGDSPQPPTSYLVQDALGAHSAACLDINVVCSGFVYGIELAHALLALYPGGRALVVATDVYSRILDYRDPRTAVLFADGAGAAILGPVPEPYGVQQVLLRSYGNRHELLGVPAGGSRLPASHRTVDAGGHFFTMQGRATADFLLWAVPVVIEETLNRAGVGPGLVDHMIPHQPNGRLLDDLAKKTGLVNASFHHSVEILGNMGSASVPVTLDRAVGDLRDGELVLLVGFGGGMAVGACLLRWFQRVELTR